jgi:hypothetical protein
MSSTRKDIGAYVKGEVPFNPISATAGGAGDGTEVDGLAINRTTANQVYRSATLLIPIRATLASGETLTIQANFQDSADGSTWADYNTATQSFSAVVLTGASGGSTDVNTIVELNVNLDAARRDVRVQIEPTLSWTGTDTANVAGVLLFGGGTEFPAT